MDYYFSTIIKTKNFQDAINAVTEALKEEGFGVLSTIDVQSTLKQKIDVDFKPYVILGACNPHFAYKALSEEDKIGVMLPCNVIVETHDNGNIEVSAVNPLASMSAVSNQNLGTIATDVKDKLQRVINSLY
ncbi:DUF302 domain-containing protein [Mangrovimonas aestuarii]|uniref:DUF302 domain-containing protein n=1 Tax=Mangrovimonas aestuarii TaxID=3018443 RepID=UPI002378F92F|nr:DUF302 domain-containing protein [Mangrovimonas aestuarii]